MEVLNMSKLKPTNAFSYKEEIQNMFYPIAVSTKSLIWGIL